MNLIMAYAPHADLIWMETAKPILEQAQGFAPQPKADPVPPKSSSRRRTTLVGRTILEDPAAARLPTLQEVLARPGANGRGGAVLLYDPKTNAELDLPCPAKEALCPRELFFNAGGSS